MSLHDTRFAGIDIQRLSGAGAGTTNDTIASSSEGQNLVLVHYVLTGYLADGASIHIAGGQIKATAPSGGGEVRLNVRDKYGLARKLDNAALDIALIHATAGNSHVAGHVVYYYE